MSRRRRGRRPPGFTPPGCRELYNVVLPMRGAEKRRFFNELSDCGGVAAAEPSFLADLCERYGLDMKPETVPDLVERFNLRFPGEPVTL